MNVRLSLLDPVCVEASDPDDSGRKGGRRRFEAGFGSFRLLRDVGRGPARSRTVVVLEDDRQLQHDEIFRTDDWIAQAAKQTLRLIRARKAGST